MVGGFENALRRSWMRISHWLEVLFYVALGVLLSVGAMAALGATFATIRKGIAAGTLGTDSFVVLEQLLLVLIFLEILHTIRLSVVSQALLMEPFLIVGLIASVRRVLVITMQAAKLVQENGPTNPELFRESMIELGMLGFLILVFVFCIYLLRCRPAQAAETTTVS